MIGLVLYIHSVSSELEDLKKKSLNNPDRELDYDYSLSLILTVFTFFFGEANGVLCCYLYARSFKMVMSNDLARRRHSSVETLTSRQIILPQNIKHPKENSNNITNKSIFTNLNKRFPISFAKPKLTLAPNVIQYPKQVKNNISSNNNPLKDMNNVLNEKGNSHEKEKPRELLEAKEQIQNNSLTQNYLNLNYQKMRSTFSPPLKKNSEKTGSSSALSFVGHFPGVPLETIKKLLPTVNKQKYNSYSVRSPPLEESFPAPSPLFSYFPKNMHSFEETLIEKTRSTGQLDLVQIHPFVEPIITTNNSSLNSDNNNHNNYRQNNESKLTANRKLGLSCTCESNLCENTLSRNYEPFSERIVEPVAKMSKSFCSNDLHNFNFNHSLNSRQIPAGENDVQLSDHLSPHTRNYFERDRNNLAIASVPLQKRSITLASFDTRLSSSRKVTAV